MKNYLPELVVGESSVSLVIEASVEPAAVLGIDEVALSGADVGVGRDGSDLGRSVARSGLRRPDADFPPLVEDQASRAAILEDGVVVLVLVELDAAVEQRTVFWVTVVALSGRRKVKP